MLRKKGLPKEIINIYKKNFWNIGEFAVNTNPKAKLCNYLIVNEKIADMVCITKWAVLGGGNFRPEGRRVMNGYG